MANTPCWPTTPGLPITSPYGWRFHPIDEVWKFHAAIDIGGGGINHPVYATQSGVVIAKGFDNSRGNYIILEHTEDEFFSRYIHLAEPAFFDVGQTVSKCQQIGIMGTTGASTGIHLDFAIATSAGGFGTEEGTIDPELYLEGAIEGGDPWGPGEWDIEYIMFSRRFLPRRR